MLRSSPGKILLQFYFLPRQALNALADYESPGIGALYAAIRGISLSLFFYLPLYLLKIKPITPAYLAVFDTPKYFLFAALMWPLFGILSWVYLGAAGYLVLRLLRYQVNIDQLLNLGGLINLAIGLVLILVDWVMVLLNLHTNPVLVGFAHILIADPWSISCTAYYYKKFFGIPIWLSILLGMLTRFLYLPLALVFIRT